ncbi:uncharacterized protein SPSK_06494 [Sporothrix schenckii 1099-18]|uniref:Bacteriophage T5 Orf172 DNA-binding domain-containing protein n=1 Tax=Sporothrix schenckii 1099-18 TaxID=1397361 RepID=A0A0F2MJM8_SPOSC|nr:uncharacterized protein SPSK_06494 [Sporothrix schenckii 1099-18]KJR89827.1 hypothetical protein SPSK_06494 [Sporothrix schenckii 1099-18]
MSLLLSDGRYKFKSRKRLRRFLDLESPYDTCLECGGSIKTDVAALLSQLLGSTVPSPSAADLLSDLSHVVICKREQCRKRAPRLYKTWCDKMWKHYLQEHGLSLNDCGSRPAGFTRKTWDKALEKTDEAADSAYESTKDGSSSDSDYETDSDSGDETEASSDEKDSTDSDKDTDTEVVGMGRLSITREPTRKTKPSFTKVTQVSAAEQRKQLLNTIVRTISQNYRRKGYIYGYRQPGLDGYIKIGYVFDTRKSQVDPVQYRLATWKTNCKHDIALVFTQKIECYATQRIESLIHKTLQKYRHEQHPPCESC